MAKIILIALWAGIPFFWQPLRGQTPGEGVKPPNHEKQKDTLGKGKAGDGKPEPSSPMVVNVLSIPHKESESTEEQAENNRKKLIDTGTVIAATLAAVFTGALVVVGWCGVRAANETLTAIKQQVAIMTRQFDQSVDFVNWKGESHRTDQLRILVDIVNVSQFQITITGGWLEFGLPNEQGKWPRRSIGTNFSIAPGKAFTVDVYVPIGLVEQSAEWVAFVVAGMLSHRHRITNEEVVQPVAGSMNGCRTEDGKWSLSYAPFVHMNQEPTEEGEQKAN
jgi:hypothetical protein